MADLHLLHADEEQIDRASIAIADGTAFVVALCPPEARLAALTYLRTHVKHLAFPESVEMGTADEMFAALSEQVEQKNRVLSLTLGRDVLGPFDALNLHREKVLKGGPVILWLDDVATLRTMRERAPDAYSYRTTMMVIRGDGGALPAPSDEESEEIKAVRKRLKRARTPIARAGEGFHLAQELRTAGYNDRAWEVANQALRSARKAKLNDLDVEHELIGLLYRELGIIAGSERRRIEHLRYAKNALTEIDGQTFVESLKLRIIILSDWPGPFESRDRTKELEARSLIHRFGLAIRDHRSNRASRIYIAIAQGNLLRAREALSEEAGLTLTDGYEKFAHMQFEADVHWRAGSIALAEQASRVAADYAAKSAITPAASNSMVLQCLLVRGELDALERLSAEAHGNTAEGGARHLEYLAMLHRGKHHVALSGMKNMLVDAINNLVDGDIFDIVGALVWLVIVWHGAQCVTDEINQSVLSDLELAHDVMMDLSGPDGPEWYPIQLRSYRAQVLRIAGKPAEALDLLRQTLNLARNTYPDLVPETGRILADHLVYAQQFDEALELIDEVEPIALEKEFLEEHARLLGDRILALVGKNTAAEQIAPHVHALRSALAATDSKRITAETLRHLAERLPMTTVIPDPISLADEAHRLFVAMPIPAEEALCLEIMGDVLASRGQIQEAKMRYANARGRLERHGLLLRVPLIEEKLLRS